MLLSGDEILNRNLIQNGKVTNIRAASYDLTIGRIITVDGNDIRSIDLEPQGIIEVISRETVDMPENLAGFAMVKTGLCDKGILALNIGVVDPLYKGRISTTLLNFSKSTLRLEKDDVFLRLTVHECMISAAYRKVVTISSKDYVRSKKNKVTKFAKTFLNLDNSIKKITDPIYSSAKSDLFKWLGGSAVVAGLILALLPVFLAYATDRTRVSISKEEIKKELKAELADEKEKNFEARIKSIEDKENLENRVKELEQKIKTLTK